LRILLTGGRPMQKEEKTSILVLIIVVGFAIAVAYHYVMGYYLGKPFPANTFLFNPLSRFLDFTLVVRQSAALTFNENQQELYGFAGAPFGQFVGYLFSAVRPASLRLPILFCSFFIVLVAMVKHYLYGLKSKLTSRQLLAIFAIVSLTYPVLFAVDRGNFDLLVCASLLLFALAYGRRHYRASTVFLALAIAMKPYTAVFILVYVFDKRYRDSLLVIFNALFLTVLSLALFKDGLFVETRQYLHELFRVNEGLSAGTQQAFTSCLYGLLTVGVKSIAHFMGAEVYLPAHPAARVAYAAIAGLALIYFAVHLWQRPRPLWKVLAVLTILLILLPYGSADYRLTYLFAPMLMYLATDETRRNDLLIVILWGLLLIPKNYYRISGDQNIGVVINPLLLTALLVCIVPDAFSKNGLYSAFRFVYERARSVAHVRRLENPQSS
jgi:hypothetical protein